MKPENKDDFISGHKACTAETLKEKGCISYDGHVSVNNPNLYVVVERWETRDDLNAHGRAPHMKVWREDSSPMKKAPTGIEVISDGKGGKRLFGFPLVAPWFGTRGVAAPLPPRGLDPLPWSG